MSAPASVHAGTLATVTVAFNPEMAVLEAQLQALPTECEKFVVDNASSPELLPQIEAITSRVGNAHLLRNNKNLGLAAAINLGVNAAAELPVPPRFVLLLDQDSEPQPGSVATLVDAFQALEAEGRNVGCVGPVLRDTGTGLTHGFHQCTRWRWRRVYPPVGSTLPLPCANLNGSGTLVSIELFQQLRGLDESLFIDHVDTEWAFRVLASGHTLWGIPNAVFAHRMGQSSVRFWWFGWRVWPSRSPERNFYLYRNTIALLHRDYVPGVWKAWAVVKLIMTAGVHFTRSRRRRDQLHEMWRGVCAARRRGTPREVR